MPQIQFTPNFIRQLKKLPKALQQEAVEKIKLLEVDPQNNFLKTHKLKGKLKDRWSFSVNYKTRIVFQYTDKQNVVLLAVGDHDVYKK